MCDLRLNELQPLYEKAVHNDRIIRKLRDRYPEDESIRQLYKFSAYLATDIDRVIRTFLTTQTRG